MTQFRGTGAGVSVGPGSGFLLPMYLHSPGQIACEHGVLTSDLTQNRPNNLWMSSESPQRWFLFLPVCQPVFLPCASTQSAGLGNTKARLFKLKRPSPSLPARPGQSGAGRLRSREKVPMY